MLLVSIAAGALAAFATTAPTGSPAIDGVLLALTVGAATWLGAAALRWDAAVLALAAAATAWNPLGAVLGVLTAIVGSAVPVSRRHRNVVTAAMVGIALNIAARSELGVVLGLSAAVFVILAATIASVGAHRRSPTVRRVARVTVAAAAALAVLATVSLALFAALAAADIRSADDHTRRGLRSLGEGDLDGARRDFAQAAERVARADRRLDHPGTMLAALVPGVAQHRRAATELTGSVDQAARNLVAELDGIDLDGLAIARGRIDLDAVRDLRQPLEAIDRELAGLQDTVSRVASPWLVPRVADGIDRLAADLDEQRTRAGDAIALALEAPALLGADEPRTYFVGFTTPVEARGIGGFLGNWAEITIDDGRIELTDFGRSDDLEAAGDPATRRFTTGGTADGELDEWLARYGAYLNAGPDGATGPAVWKNITMSPDMATTGRAIADLYPQSGGRRLDGVFMMDVYTLIRFLEYTGPIDLPERVFDDVPLQVTTDNAAELLLNDQYDVSDRADRADALEEFSAAVIDRLLTGRLPPPTDLLDNFGPMVDQGRFTGWAARSSEQELLGRIGMSGTLAPVGLDLDRDALAVTFNNAVGNKIDYFLDASGSYSVVADSASSTAQAELVVQLTNTAPVAGEPRSVIGNAVGLPVGWNRTWVSIYSRLPVVDARIEDRPVAVQVGAEAGYFVTSTFIMLAPGETTELSLSMAGRLDVADGYELALRTPPAVNPMPVTVNTAWVGPDGRVHEASDRQPEPGLGEFRVDDER